VICPTTAKVNRRRIIFRIFSANDWKRAEFFRIIRNTFLICLLGKMDSGLLYVVQSYPMIGTVNPLVVGSNPTSGDTDFQALRIHVLSAFFLVWHTLGTLHHNSPQKINALKLSIEVIAHLSYVIWSVTICRW
jgi:hypothetical protein